MSTPEKQDISSIIKIAPGAKIGRLELNDNVVIGDGTFIETAGQIQSVRVEQNIHLRPEPVKSEPAAFATAAPQQEAAHVATDVPWWRAHLWQLAVTVVGGIIVAVVVLVFGLTPKQ